MPESTEFFAQPFLAGSSGDPSSTLELETLTVGAPQAQAGLAQAPDPSLSPQSAIHLEREYLKENRASIHGPSLSGRIHGLGGVVGEVSVETGKVGKAPLYHFAAFNNMLYEFEERAKGQNKVSESWGPKSGAQSCGIWGSGRGARTPVHDGQTPAYGESRIQQVVGCPNGTKGASVYSGNMGNGAWLNGFPVCTSMVGSDGGDHCNASGEGWRRQCVGTRGRGRNGQSVAGAVEPPSLCGADSVCPTHSHSQSDGGGAPVTLRVKPQVPLPDGAKVPREPSGPGHFAGAAPTPPGSGTGGGKPLSRPTAALTPAALLAEPSFCYNFERIGLKLNNKNANPQTSRVEYQESVSWAGNFGSGDPEFSSSIPPPAALMEIERTTLMGYSVWASGREMGGEPTPKNEPIAATALSAFPNLQGPPSPPPGADVKGCRSAHP